MVAETNIKNVRDLISRNQEVKHLTEIARQSDELQRVVVRLLPSMLADYCQVRSFERGVLTLGASTGSAATQLRFLAQQMLPKLQKTGVFRGLESIVIKVQGTGPIRPGHKIRATPPVSQANCRLLQETADGISDTNLADSIRRLAVTLGKNGKD